jgi:hypothetical protein
VTTASKPDYFLILAVAATVVLLAFGVSLTF